MAENPTLAGFDMVLGLSETTINYQFWQLYRRNIIPDQWTRLIRIPSSTQQDYIASGLSHRDAEFRSQIDLWHNATFQIQFNSSWLNPGPVLPVPVALPDLDFEFGWDVSVDAPKIFIRDQGNRNMSLQIFFQRGTLYHRSRANLPVESYSLNNVLYAFHVNTGKEQITKGQMLEDAQSEFERMIGDSHLTEEDFTIERLFLNLANTGTHSIDNELSDFPEELRQPLRDGVQAYFRSLASDNETPFLLGYGITTSAEADDEQPVFQPTSMAISASFSDRLDPSFPIPGQFSACNFLMMLNHRTLQAHENTGVLPFSLPELGVDTSASTDGVFAIEHDSFLEYMRQMDQFVQDEFNSMPGVRIRNRFRDGVMTAIHNETRRDDQIETLMTVTREPLTNTDGPMGLRIRYRLEVRITVSIYVWVARVGRITLSTSGTHLRDAIDQPGQPGFLDFNIRTGTEGRFQLDYNFTGSPVIAYDQATDNRPGDFFSAISQLANPVGTIVNNIVHELALDLGRRHTLQANALVNKLHDIDILNKSNSTILPLAQLYTFNNIRYHSDLGIITYDIAYAPVVN